MATPAVPSVDPRPPAAVRPSVPRTAGTQTTRAITVSVDQHHRLIQFYLQPVPASSPPRLPVWRLARTWCWSATLEGSVSSSAAGTLRWGPAPGLMAPSSVPTPPSVRSWPVGTVTSRSVQRTSDTPAYGSVRQCPAHMPSQVSRLYRIELSIITNHPQTTSTSPSRPPAPTSRPPGGDLAGPPASSGLVWLYSSLSSSSSSSLSSTASVPPSVFA